jgi:hypothetical protein
MTSVRQDPPHAVPSDTAANPRWMPTGHAMIVALVLGMAAGTIAAFLLTLARVESVVR